MKRLLTISIALGFVGLLASPLWAIDAKKKSGSSTSTTSTPADSSRSGAVVKKSKHASNKTLLERLKKDVRESSKQSGAAQYDNYIDKNSDGVDDRVKDRPASVETAKEKETEKPKEPEQSEDDSARVRVKKKPRS